MSLLKVYFLLQIFIFWAVTNAVKSEFEAITKDNLYNNNNSSLYRLPKNIWPISYNVTLLTNVTRGNFTYKGVIIIDLEVATETKQIIFHKDKLIINRGKSMLEKKITDTRFEKLTIESQNYNDDTQFFTITLPSYLTLGRYQLTLHFIGEVLDDVFGFYRSSYKVNSQVKWLATTQFSSVFARRAFPCFDEPVFKATFQLQIGHYSNETVSSNTLPESRQLMFSEGPMENYYVTRFAKTPRMPTYLVGWVIHDFKRVNSTKPHMWLWSHSRDIEPNKSPLLTEGPLIEASLETYTAMANPVRKLEQLAIPDFRFTAMENWGMITYPDSLGSANYDTTPLRMIHSYLVNQAHEYAHSYFGNLVTPSFWSVAWLKEGFAVYFSYVSLDSLHEDWRMMQIFTVEVLQNALLLESEPEHTRTMNGRGVGSPRSAKASMDFVPYDKGASVIRMFAEAIGEKPFRRAMQAYLKNRQYEAAVPEDLYRELESVANKMPAPVGEMFDSWANQSHYPLVSVARKGTQVTISQRAFNLRGKANSSYWWVPVKLLSSAGESEMHWLPPSDRTMTIQLPEQATWFVVNPHLHGYYRVEYAVDDESALIALLRSESMELWPSASRAAFIDDSFNLARAGLRNYSLPLSLADYLKRETDYVPWIAATRAIQLLDEKLRNQPVAHRAFRPYALDVISPIYNKLTLEEKASDARFRKMHRDLILTTACSIGLEDCILKAKSIFDQWIDNYEKTVPANLKNVVYRVGIMNGTDQEWTQLWRRFLKIDSQVDKELMINALAYTKNISFLIKYLEFSIQPHFDVVKQYRLLIVQAIMSKSITGFDTVFNYVRNNLSKIINLQGMEFVEKILESFGQQITTLKQKQKLITFLDKNASILKTALETGKKAMKTADDNIEWINRCAADIITFMNTL